jgi:hypothetical protein
MRSQRAVPVLCMRAVKAAGPFWMLCLECSYWMRCVRTCDICTCRTFTFVRRCTFVHTCRRRALRACRCLIVTMPDARTRIYLYVDGVPITCGIWTATDVRGCGCDGTCMRYINTDICTHTCADYMRTHALSLHAAVRCIMHVTHVRTFNAFILQPRPQGIRTTI